MSNRKKKIQITTATVLTVAVVILLILVGKTLWIRYHKEANSDPYIGQEESQIFYKGNWYTQRKDVETLLLIGVDKYEMAESEYYVNNQQSDFLLLLVYDKTAHTCKALPLNRDTVTKITRLGLGGAYAGTYDAQLALAYTYGSGRQDSGRNTVEAVSNLLYGADISHFISLSMEGVAVLNDAVGGVTVTVKDDFSGVTDALPMGETVTLHGDDALTFVRSRGGMAEPTNINRMARQRQYMDGLLERLRSCMQDDDFMLQLVTDINEYMVSDCTVNQLSTLSTEIANSEVSVLDAPAGESKEVNGYMQFHVDEDALKQTVIDLFYQQVD